jgi:aspartate/methionine/tyrosine aminotransferase
VGAVIANDAVIAAARRVSVHSVFNVPVAMQRAALGALAGGEAWVKEAGATYLRARDASVAALAGAPVRFSVAEGGTYLFLDLSPVLGDRPTSVALEAAIDRGVLLAPGDAFGRTYASWARLCYTAAPLPRVLEGIARLRDALESIR